MPRSHDSSLGSATLRAALLLLLASAAAADPVVGLNTFTAGAPARAAEVNANFTAVKTAVDNSHQRIVTLETDLAALRAQLATPQMEALFAIAPYVTLFTLNGRPTVVVSGANLQIINGEDSTTVNGLGNLIVGYDEERPSTAPYECSVVYNATALTPVRTQTQCNAANGSWEINHKTGSHNLVIGPRHNYAGSDGLVAGVQNSITGRSTSVSGGMANHAGHFAASVSGGENNWAYEQASSVTGGSDNQAISPWSSISGGSLNQTTAFNASISGGEDGRARGLNSTISGGARNIAEGMLSSVTGGLGNTARANQSSIHGGIGNQANALRSSILGGNNQLNGVENGTTPVLP